MAIRSSLYFEYGGRKSTDFGISNVNISSGMLEEPFLATRQVNEVKIRGRDKPYFATVTHDCLKFTLSFAFNDTWDTDKIRDISRWLSEEFYKPLVFSDNLNLIYYAMLDGDSTLVHNGLSQGYINLTMRCDSPYAYSPIFMSPLYDFSDNPSNGTAIQFPNLGDINIFPEMWITKVGNGDCSIANNSNGGNASTFVNLTDTETVYVDNANEIIISDQIPTIYRYSNFNNNFLEIVYGMNNLHIYGNCKVRFRYQHYLLQG